MLDKSLILPFIVEAHDGKESVSYPAEVACVVCLASLQRRRTGFLRDVDERLSSLVKIYYPIWAVPFDDSCLTVDGLAFLSSDFAFKEPKNVGLLVEDLKKNSAVQTEFMLALGKQAKNVGQSVSSSGLSFKALITDRDILNFFLEYVRSSAPLDDEEAVVVPSEIDEERATEVREVAADCLRRIRANVKAVQYYLKVLDGEVKFHERMILNEVEFLKEKCDAEVGLLKPEVERKVEKLKAKHDTQVTRILKANEKEVAGLEKKRQIHMRKLHALERRKSTLEKRRGYREYALERFNREINDVKKDIRLLSIAIENVGSESNKSIKRVDEEFQRAKALEEEKIKKLSTACETKIGESKKMITTMTSDAASITKEYEKLADEMKQEASVFRDQIAIDWKLARSTLIRVPIYVAVYVEDREVRLSLFSPMIISEDVSFLKGLRKILTFTSEPRLKLLMRPRSSKLQEILSSSLIRKIQSEETFRENMNVILRTNNLLDQEGFERTLVEGLKEAEKKRWLTAEEAMTVYSGLEERKNE